MSGSKPEELWAYVDDGGLVCGILPGLGVVPLVSNKKALVDHMGAIAALHARSTGRSVSLVRYALRCVEHTIEPGDTP